MRAAQFVLLSVAVAVALSQPPALGAGLDPVSPVTCGGGAAVYC